MRLFKETGWRFWWLALSIFVFDQLTKLWVVRNFELGESIQLLPVFNFTYARNYGAAFSFLGDAGGWQRWLFTIIAIVVSGVIAVWLSRLQRTQLKLSLALTLVLAGALGNLIDRLIFGYVVDFIHVYYQDWHYPIFNIADCAICMGAGLLIWDSFTENEVDEQMKAQRKMP